MGKFRTKRMPPAFPVVPFYFMDRIVSMQLIMYHLASDDQQRATAKTSTYVNKENSTISTNASTETTTCSVFDNLCVFQLYFRPILGILFSLMVMLLLLSSRKKAFPIFLLMSLACLSAVGLSFLDPRLANFKIDASEILIRIPFFSTISFYMYHQIKEKRRTGLVACALCLYFLIATLNPHDAQHHLAKYLVSAALVVMVSPTPIKKCLDSRRDLLYVIFFFIPVDACGFVYNIPWVYGNTFWHRISSKEMFLNSDGTFISIIFGAVLILLISNDFVIDALLPEKRKRWYRLPTNILNSFIFSPVICFVFVLLEQLMFMLESENIWSYIRPFLVVHLLTILANLTREIKSSVVSKLNRGKDFSQICSRYRSLVLFILIGSICLLAFACVYCSYQNERMIFIIVGLSIYCICLNLFHLLLFHSLSSSPDVRIVSEYVWAFNLCNIESIFRLQLIFFVILGILLFCYFNAFGLCVYLGFAYFGFRMRDEFGAILRSVKLARRGRPRKITAQILAKAKIECFICGEKMISGCKTPCRPSHSFHKHCILNWMFVNSECPLCRRGLKNDLKTIKTGFCSFKNDEIENLVDLSGLFYPFGPQFISLFFMRLLARFRKATGASQGSGITCDGVIVAKYKTKPVEV